jgi:hypothetical protein
MSFNSPSPNPGEGKLRRRHTMKDPERITPEEVHQKLDAGKVLLVCAYEDESKFRKMRLQGAISFNEFKSKIPSLSKDQEIVFY